jgi:hypothetical protein
VAKTANLLAAPRPLIPNLILFFCFMPSSFHSTMPAAVIAKAKIHFDAIPGPRGPGAPCLLSLAPEKRKSTLRTAGATVAFITTARFGP